MFQIILMVIEFQAQKIIIAFFPLQVWVTDTVTGSVYSL